MHSKAIAASKKDFIEIFKIMRGLPVTVRLLDPPLHEFLPKSNNEINDVAVSLNIPVKELEVRISELHEQNPMLGHRGCRLAISFPEIYEMQCTAIFEALVECKKTKNSINHARNHDPFSFNRSRNKNYERFSHKSCKKSSR